MENIFTGRRRNMTILVGVLTIQFFGLAGQIRRPTDQGTSTPLLRTWVVNAITPFEEMLVHVTGGVRKGFGSYFYLRNVRKENEGLKQQIQNMTLEQVRLQQDAAQARRLQKLLGFKEQFISETLPAQVIGTSGSDISRLILIDKGLSDGLKDNMAVITPDGVVGKVSRAYHSSSQVLLINDPTWGAGAILTDSRLQGIVKGTQGGAVQLQYIMSDNQLKPGEPIVTSGGDGIFPKGLPIGAIKEISGANREGFLNIRVQPAADLNRLEEVLVITKIVEKQVQSDDLSGPVRASDILAQRLPSVPEKPAEAPAKPGTAGDTTGAPAGGTAATPSKRATGNPVSATKLPASATASVDKKPGAAAPTSKPSATAGTPKPASAATTPKQTGGTQSTAKPTVSANPSSAPETKKPAPAPAKPATAAPQGH